MGVACAPGHKGCGIVGIKVFYRETNNSEISEHRKTIEKVLEIDRQGRERGGAIQIDIRLI